MHPTPHHIIILAASFYIVPSTAVTALPILTHGIVRTALSAKWCHYPPFTGEEAAAPSSGPDHPQSKQQRVVVPAVLS